MRYVGSKARYVKYIKPFIDKAIIKGNGIYVEPFIGGANMFSNIEATFKYGYDNNKYLIACLNAVKNDWIPPSNIPEEEYYNIRDNKDNYLSELVGFVGFAGSFSAKWFGGFARGKTVKDIDRNYFDETKRNILKQIDGLQNSIIECKTYDEIQIINNSVVYCDPPYNNSVSPYSNTKFDTDRFWNLVREINNRSFVFVSEYNAPDDFICVWSKEVNNTLDKNTGSKKGIERLFIHESKEYEFCRTPNI